ncbi:MAG: hypothetical protein JW909_03665 [Planctomycetes bacterium]|nr:hypothetical protein [Planctomycetota bacterium]
MRLRLFSLSLFVVSLMLFAGEEKPSGEEKPALPPASDADVVAIVVAHAGDMKGETVYADLFGRPVRGKFMKADASALTIEVMGSQFPFPWDKYGDRRILDIGAKAARTADEFIVLARYAHGRNMAEDIDAMLNRALEADAGIAEEVRKIRNILYPPEERRPVLIIHTDSDDAKPTAPRTPRYPALPPSSWQCVGFGGGGAMYTPVISPHDPKVGLITCDMGGIYMTRDGGRHWRQIPGFHLGHGVAFHSTDPNVVFVGLSAKLYRSPDLGATWQAVTQDRQSPMCAAWHVLTDPDDGGAVWVAFGWGGETGNAVRSGNRFIVERSRNGGLAFSDASNGFPDGQGMVKKLALDRTSPVGNRTVYAATTGGFFRSRDAGGHWEKAGSGIPHQDLREVVSLYDKTARKCTVLVSTERGGIYRSEDGGDTFTASHEGIAPAAPIEEMCASWNDPLTAWAAGADIWKSVDGGKTWTATYDAATKYGAWLCVFRPWAHKHARGIGCNPKNVNHVWYTGDMAFFASTDGGASWTEMDGHPMPEGTRRPSFSRQDSWALYPSAPKFYDGGGLEVTFCYQVWPDPHNEHTFYTGYADVGGWKTLDHGKSWTNNMGRWNEGIKSEWRNSCYEIAVDPARPGHLYGVYSGKHNLPGANVAGGQYDIGGFACSKDGGIRWTPYENVGLPDRPPTSIIIDRRPAQEPVLYVASFGEGVFRSLNAGKRWERFSDGLPSGARAWRLRQSPDNTVYLACALNNPGGVWKYSETDNKWVRIDTNPRISDVRDVIVGDADSPGFVAVAAAGADGGVFASMDSGATWKRIFQQDVRSVDCTPDRRFWVAGGSSLWRSANGGQSWQRVEDFPFRGINDVTLNPRNPGELWVGTSGCGVYVGPGANSP